MLFVSSLRPKKLHYDNCSHFKDGDKVIGTRRATMRERIICVMCRDCQDRGARAISRIENNDWS
jgi:hypothetical protein